MSEFEKKLSALINEHSLEKDSGTPNYILAKYLNDCLGAFNSAIKLRRSWYRSDIPEEEG